MKRSIMGNRLLALLLTLIYTMMIIPAAYAQETPPEWTIDIGRQLLAEGWEDYALSADAVVGYAIHFREVEQSIAKRLGFGFDLSTGREGPGLWGIAGRDLEFGLLFDTPSYFAPNFQYGLGHHNQTNSHDSWLLTLYGRPLNVDVSSTRVPTPSKEHKEERLEITILPKNVDERGQIESEITIRYETLNGAVANVHTTTWVGAASETPIAMVSRQVNVGKKVGYQYFAVYLAGTLIPDELIPKDVPFLAMGSVMGMQQFMEQIPENRLTELGLGLSYNEGHLGWLVEGSLPIGDKHRAYGSAQSLPRTMYVLGAEGAINKELFLVAEASGALNSEVTLRLGLRDELNLGERVTVSATVLPIRFTLAGPKSEIVFDWRVHAEYSGNDYGIWYQAHNDRKRVQHNVGLTLFKSKPVGARLSWAWDEEHGGIVTVGIQMKF